MVPQQPPTRPSPNSRTNPDSASASSRRGQRVDGAVRAELRQPGVRHHRHPDLGVPGQVAQVLAHLGGAGGAVQPDVVDAQRLQGGQRGADLRAEQHRAGGLHGDVHDHRHLDAGGGHRPLGADARPTWSAAGPGRSRSSPRRCRRPACRRPAGRRRPAARCTARGRASAAWCRARPSRARTGAGPAVLNSSASARASAAPAWASSKIRSAMSYSARLARLAPKVFVSIASTPDLEVGAVHRPDDVRPGHVEDLVAALEAGEVVHRRVLGLQHRAHRAVRHENALGERGQQGVRGGWSLLQGNSSRRSGCRYLRPAWGVARAPCGRRRLTCVSEIPDLRNPVMIAAFEGWNDAGDAATAAVEQLGSDLGRDPADRAGSGGFLRLPGDQADRPADRRRDQDHRLADHQAVGVPAARVAPATSSWCTASSRTSAGGRSVTSCSRLPWITRWRPSSGSVRCWPTCRTPGRSRSPGRRTTRRPRPGSGWPAPATRGRPGSPGCSRTPACRPASRRCRSGRRCRTTCRRRRRPRPPWRCCTGSRRSWTSRCRWARCPAQADEWETEVSQIASEDEEISEYIRALEEREEEDEPLKPASGESIAAEFERYLRRRGPRPGEGRR